MPLRPTLSSITRRLFSYWRSPAGNRLKVHPDDTFLVSYPRSGNTWLRFMLGEVLHEEEATFKNIGTLMPDIYHTSRARLDRLPRPRYLKSHEPYDPRYPRVVYLVRDPRDVAISYYYWMLKLGREPEGGLKAFLETFAADKTPYSGWGRHVRSWYTHKDTLPRGCLFVRYEDLLARPEAQLQRILQFLQIDVPGEHIRQAVEHNAFSRMQKKEVRDRRHSLLADARQDVPFVRKGQARQWQETFTPQQRQMFVEAYGDLMIQFGYDR